MRVAIVSAYYSQGMGYSENCLPKALAALGHEVHLITSTYNVFGNRPEYESTYAGFLGPAQVEAGSSVVDGYHVLRLPGRDVRGYVWMDGLIDAVREIRPEVVHSLAIASLQTFALARVKPSLGFRLFTENHQHMSAVRPFLKQPGGSHARRALYWMTRTLPTRLASRRVDWCYAMSPDCVEVAQRFYGVPDAILSLRPLGTDTDLFRPAETQEERAARRALRSELGFADDDIVCIYTGRFAEEKNPLVLARAIDTLAEPDARFKGLFVGEGMQREEIAACRNVTIVPFMRYADLAPYYRAADVGVWPRQESMSMLDAAASGLPLVVSDRIGDRARIEGTGLAFRQDDVGDLAERLISLAPAEARRTLGREGRRKMVEQFSWRSIARGIVADYEAAAGDRTIAPGGVLAAARPAASA